MHADAAEKMMPTPTSEKSKTALTYGVSSASNAARGALAPIMTAHRASNPRDDGAVAISSRSLGIVRAPRDSLDVESLVLCVLPTPLRMLRRTLSSSQSSNMLTPARGHTDVEKGAGETS